MMYQDLHALLQSDKHAHAYFMQQPEYVQGDVLQRAGEIRSLRALEEAVRAARKTLQR